MNEEPCLSIVITAFNQHHEFANSLAGLACQIEQNPVVPVEVVVVDNGSEPPLDGLLKASSVDAPTRYIWRTPVRRNFRPGSARNIGIGVAKGEFILFLDGDCIPGPSYLRDHWERLKTSKQSVVTLGHRVFIDGESLDATMVHASRGDLDNIPEVASASNYALPRDRRLEEFETFDRHPMPFHCCHGCNLGVRRVDIGNVGGFDEDFDGYWGYEDIECGHRMWAEGATFVYVRTAYVYHQEAKALPRRTRAIEAHRNYELACKKIPGFRAFRDRLHRPYYTSLLATAEKSPPGNAG